MRIVCLLFLTFLFSVACTGPIGGSTSTIPRGDGQGFTGIVTYANARVRCETTNLEARFHKVVCRAVYVGPDDKEYLGITLAAGLSLSWKEVNKLEGGDAQMTCAVRDEGLTQVCDIHRLADDGVKLEFTVSLRQDTATRDEKEIVMLPLVVNTFGEVPLLRNYRNAAQSFSATSESMRGGVAGPRRGLRFTQGSGEAGGALTPLIENGYQPDEFVAVGARFGIISSMCARANSIFFSTANHIYHYDRASKMVKLHAGSGNHANKNVFTHRFRVAFNGTPYLACDKDSLIASDPGNNRILRLRDSGEVELIAGNGEYGYYFGEGPAVAAQLANPTSVTLGKDGAIYFVDAHNHLIRKIGTDRKISKVAGVTRGGCCDGDGGPALNARVGYPISIRFDNEGSLVLLGNGIRKISSAGIISTVKTGVSPVGVAFLPDNSYVFPDAATEKIHKLSPDGTLSDFAGSGSWGSWVSLQGDDVPYAQTHLSFLDWMASEILFLDDGSLLMPMTGEGRIRKFSGGKTTTLAGGNMYLVENLSNATVDASTTSIGGVSGLALGPDGKLYFSDGAASRIRRVDMANNKIEAVAGRGIPGYDGRDNIPLLDVYFYGVGALAFQPDGSLLVADTNNGRIRRISADFSKITNFAGAGPLSDGPDGTPALSSNIFPNGMAVGADGTVYFTSYAYNTIRKITPDGILGTVAGVPTGYVGAYCYLTPNCGFAGDGGPAVAAKLFKPTYVAVDSKGSVYVSDLGNQRIRKITPDGIIRTIAGTGTEGFSGDGGPATQAMIKNPGNLFVAPDGRVLFSDEGNSRIRVLTPDALGQAYTISTIVGGDNKSDCASSIKTNLDPTNNLMDQIAANLSQLCIGTPGPILLKSSCQQGSGELNTFFGQGFGGYSNIVRVTSPCPI